MCGLPTELSNPTARKIRDEGNLIRKGLADINRHSFEEVIQTTNQQRKRYSLAIQ